MKSKSKRKNSQTKADNGWVSTEMRWGNTNAHQSVVGVTLSKESYHQSCRTLPYDRFIEISVTGNLFWLIISGNPSKEKLERAWGDILEEYGSLAKTEKSKSIFECWRSIEYTHFRIKYVQRCIAFLQEYYDEEIALSLVELGFDFIQKNDDTKEYFRQLQMLELEAGALIVKLGQLQAEYQRLSPQGEELRMRDRQEFERELAILEKHMGFGIKKDTTTVFEFVVKMNVLMETANKLKSK